MNDYDMRDCIIEEVRFLMTGGYRTQELPKVEAGIARFWDAQEWWAEAIHLRLDDVITALAA
jgi:hypothetical protein